MFTVRTYDIPPLMHPTHWEVGSPLPTGNRHDFHTLAAFANSETMARGSNPAASTPYKSSFGWKLYLRVNSRRPNPRHVTSFIPPRLTQTPTARIVPFHGPSRTATIGERVDISPSSGVALHIGEKVYGEVVYANCYQRILRLGRIVNMLVYGVFCSRHVDLAFVCKLVQMSLRFFCRRCVISASSDFRLFLMSSNGFEFMVYHISLS